MAIDGGRRAKTRWRERAAIFGHAALLASSIAIVSSACGVLTPAPQGGEAPPSGVGLDDVERVFGPAWPDGPAGGRAVRIDRAHLRADGHVLVVEFVGAKAFDPANACSAAYEPWLRIRGAELDVEVVELPRGISLGGGCSAEGYLHIYGLRLTEPFVGTTVNDLGGGGTLLVGARPDTAAPTSLPPGWRLRLALAEEPGPPPTWLQVYAPTPIPDDPPYDGPGRIVLHQAFGTTGEWSDALGEKSRERGGRPTSVTLAGQPTTLWEDAASGELLVAWTLDGRSAALVANRADVTPEALIRIAESVAIP